MYLQYKLDSSEIKKRTLWMSVWDFDRFGRNQFLGEVRLSLSTLNLTDPAEHWYTLLDKVSTHRMYTVATECTYHRSKSCDVFCTQDESHSVDLTLHGKPSSPSPPPGREFQSTVEAPQKEVRHDEPPTPPTSDTLPLTSLESVTQSEELHSDPPGHPPVPSELHGDPPGHPSVPSELHSDPPAHPPVPSELHSEPVATPLIDIRDLETAELEEHEVHLKPKAGFWLNVYTQLTRTVQSSSKYNFGVTCINIALDVDLFTFFTVTAKGVPS